MQSDSEIKTLVLSVSNDVDRAITAIRNHLARGGSIKIPTKRCGPQQKLLASEVARVVACSNGTIQLLIVVRTGKRFRTRLTQPMLRA